MKEYKPEVFIGSSSEAMSVATIVQEVIDKAIDEVNVKIWNQDTFSLNQSTLESILRNADAFDFGIFIFSPDDLVTMRDKKSTTSRDNVVFEQGLFLGRLGPRRSFVLIDTQVEHILSDYKGITISTYDSGSPINLQKSIEEGCRNIIKAIQDGLNTFEFSAFPSTALAIGYYENFLVRMLDKLYGTDEVIVGDQLYKYSEIELNILIPDDLGILNPVNLKRKLKALQQFRLPTDTRDYPFFISAPKSLVNGKLEMVDIPSTLFTSRQVVDYLLPDRAVSDNETKARMEAREVRNFKQTIEILLRKNFREAFEAGEIKVRWMSDADALFSSVKSPGTK